LNKVIELFSPPQDKTPSSLFWQAKKGGEFEGGKTAAYLVTVSLPSIDGSDISELKAGNADARLRQSRIASSMNGHSISAFISEGR